MVYSRSIVAAIIAASALSALAAPVPEGQGGKPSEGKAPSTADQKGQPAGSNDMHKHDGPGRNRNHGHGHRKHSHGNDPMSATPVVDLPTDTTSPTLPSTLR